MELNFAGRFFKNINQENVLSLLLFLFPIFSLSIRHWTSFIFSTVTLMALIFAWQKRERLHKEERIFIYAFLAYFLVLLLSSTVNGWTHNSYHRLGTESKYLVFIPMYLWLRKFPSAWPWLLKAIPIGGCVLGLQAIYDIYVIHNYEAVGIYGPIIFGDLSVLIFAFSILFISRNRDIFSRANLFYFISMIFSGYAAVFSLSRNAWLALAMVLVLIWLPFIHRRAIDKKFAVLVLMVIVGLFIVSSYTNSSWLPNRLSIAVSEYDKYFDKKVKTEHRDVTKTSIGTRLELWRSSVFIFLQHPILGVGPGNTGIAINALVDAGRVDANVYRADAQTQSQHAHSAYFESIASTGGLGLITLMTMLGYPLFFFLMNAKYNRFIASMGIMHIFCFAIFALTEVPFIHDNFSSIFLIYLGVLFSWLTHDKYQTGNDVSQS